MVKQETYIFDAVSAIRKIQPIKPSVEKIFQYLDKTDKSVNRDLLFVNIEDRHRIRLLES